MFDLEITLCDFELLWVAGYRVGLGLSGDDVHLLQLLLYGPHQRRVDAHGRRVGRRTEGGRPPGLGQCPQGFGLIAQVTQFAHHLRVGAFKLVETLV